MLTENNFQELAGHLPPKSLPAVCRWLENPEVKLRICGPRTSKIGDYRPINNGKGHLISVNGNLNQYSFLLTLVHEIAHMHCHRMYGNRIKPHGSAWRQEFKRLMALLELNSIFPPDLLPNIEKYMKKPLASSFSDVPLSLALRKYDVVREDCLTLSEVDVNTRFSTRNGKVYVKGSKQRKRFKCKEVKSGRQYLFSPMAEVSVPDCTDE